MTLLLNFMYVDNYIWIWWMLNGIWSLWNDSMGAMIKSSGWVKMSPFGIFPLILWFLDIFVWTYETLVHSIFRYCTVLQTLYICVYIYGTNGQSSCWWTFRLLPIYHLYKCCCCEHFCTCLLMKEFLWGASAVQQVMIDHCEASVFRDMNYLQKTFSGFFWQSIRQQCSLMRHCTFHHRYVVCQ